MIPAFSVLTVDGLTANRGPGLNLGGIQIEFAMDGNDRAGGGHPAGRQAQGRSLCRR